jgi:hypothetical protein
MRCYACKKSKFLLNKGPPIGSTLLFVRGAARVKNISFLLNKGPPIGSPFLFVCGAAHVKAKNFTIYNVSVMGKEKLSFFKHIKISHIIFA